MRCQRTYPSTSPKLLLLSNIFQGLMLNGEFIATVQQQLGTELPSSRPGNFQVPFSASSAACDHIHNWVLVTPEVYLISSLIALMVCLILCRSLGYLWVCILMVPTMLLLRVIYSSLDLQLARRPKMDATGAELVEEKTLAYSCLN